MKVERQTALRGHLYRHGASSVAELAAAMRASIATVRRDLQELEQEGVVRRSHGGAQLVTESGVEVAFKVREEQNLAAKREIAAAAYARLAPHRTIMLDAGTTALQIARRLRVGPMPLTVVTNGLPIAQELVDIPGVTVIMLAGQVRMENLSLVGPLAEASLDRLWFDQLFLGATAIAADLRLFGQDSTEARLNEHMLSRAAESFLLADATKFGLTGSFLVARLQDVGTVLTDASLSEEWRRRLQAADVKLTVAAPDA